MRSGQRESESAQLYIGEKMMLTGALLDDLGGQITGASKGARWV